MHKFYRREIRFSGAIYVSFSNELRTCKGLNWFERQGSEDRRWAGFLRLTAVNHRVLIINEKIFPFKI